MGHDRDARMPVENDATNFTRRGLLQRAAWITAAAAFPCAVEIAAQDVSPVMTALSTYMSEARSHALPDEVAEIVKHHTLDTLAAMVSGSELAPGRAAIRFARIYGGAKVATVVASNVLSGLIETLAGPPYNGHVDLPVLANHLQLEADDIFHLGESLQLLRFAQLSEGDLVLTEAGKRFANLETDARKKLFAEHLMSYVPVMGLIRRVLDERPSHTAPAARFRNELEDYMSEDRADETLKTIVSWARYAELFAYDEQSETFSLENPH